MCIRDRQRLEQVLERAVLDREGRALDVGRAGHEQDGDVSIVLVRVPQQVDAA